jgi:hypothetical protein
MASSREWQDFNVNNDKIPSREPSKMNGNGNNPHRQQQLYWNDALKEVFPFSKKHKAASELTLALTSLFIDAQLEWENIFSGRYNNEEIMNRLHKLRKLQLEAEGKSFPEGLAKKATLFEQAQNSASQYFATTYNVRIHQEHV